MDALALDAVQAGATAGRAAAPLRLLGLAAVGNVPALLLFLALAAACMALCGKALAKPYLRLLTLEPGRTKAEYRAKTQKKQPPRRALLRRELLHVLKSLTPREERVITLRFGLEDGRARTLEELGKEFNVTRERVRQIEAKALRKLRHPSRAKLLRDYLDE